MKRNLLTSALMALGLMAGGTGVVMADVVKIGVLAPVSGKSAADGEEMVNGAQLALSLIHI